MGSNNRVGRACVVALTGACFSPTLAWAGSHTWRINEVFSSADGSVQFIELRESCNSGGETGLSGHQVKSNANTVNLVSLAPGSSADKYLLFGTANLTTYGGPAPDYIIPANFFSLTGDLLQYTPYHSCTVATGTVPTNGTSSLNRATGCVTSTCPTTVALNSPKNFAGASTPVTVPTCTDKDNDDYGSPGDPSCPNGSQLDCNDNNPAINPGADEICNDGIDNNCDGNIDCDDPTCLDPPCVPTVSQWGLIIMTALLLGAGGAITARRRARPAT